jgi:hypothetical protein
VFAPSTGFRPSRSRWVTRATTGCRPVCSSLAEPG